MINVTKTLQPYFKAGYPIVAVETVEEKRLVDGCKEAWKKNKLFSISASGGLFDVKSERAIDANANFQKAFQHIANQSESFLIVFDFHHVVQSPQMYRALLNAMTDVKVRGSLIVLVAPYWNLPNELKHEIPVVHIPLPTTDELETALKVVLEADKSHGKVNELELITSARGLTMNEAENTFALSALNDYDKGIVEKEKMRLVRSVAMSIERPVGPDLLAGLGRLKEYVNFEVLPVKDDEQLRVRGLLLVGVPGTGKSLSSKVIASLLQQPLIRLDIAAAKGSLLGQSESQLRQALATADAVAPCVLWLDEIEKGVAGHASSHATDGGTTLSMVGTLLTWMQEHESPVLVIATCNDFTRLPAELTRAGRFDEKFFLDLPLKKEREAIAMVHLKRLGCKGDGLIGLADAISDLTEDWTGAEIEQLIKSCARRTRREITLESLERASKEIIPISKSADIKALRAWANENLRTANDHLEAPATGRRVTRQ